MDAPSTLGNWQSSIDNVLEDIKQTRDEFEIFSSLRTLKDRIDFVVKGKLLRSVDWLPVYFDGCEKGHDKSESVAEVWKNKGNKLFQQRKFKEALAMYTQACITAPDKKGTILALSFGNRSASLFHLSQYQKCILDIDRALLLGFPSSSRHKLLLRKGSALCKLGWKAKANEAMNAVRQFVESKEFKLKDDQKEAFVKDIESLQANIDALPQDHSEMSSQRKDEKCEVERLYAGENDVVSQASKTVTLTFSPSKGRHLVANTDIPQGSPIIMEKPFSAVLLPDHYETHCHHCFSRLPVTSVGCKECSNVQFCDEMCRDTAWSSFHKMECPYLYLLHSIGIAHLSLRTVLLAGADFLTDFLSKESKRDNDMKGLNSDGIYDCSYFPVYHLMTHEEATAPPDMLQYSLTAVLLLSMLIHSGYLDNKLNDKNLHSSPKKHRKALLKNLFYGAPTKNAAINTEELPSGVLDIGDVLLRHILQLVCNAHAITSLESSPSNTHDTKSGMVVEDFEQVRIATAIYPTASLMNHSCDPTIVSSFRKDILTVKTIKDVKKGEEVFNCYGPHSRRMTTTDRQEVLLSQYHFICQCTACGSQPMAHLRFGAFKCQKCAGVLSDNCCTECGATFSSEDLKEKQKIEKELKLRFDSGVQALRDKKFETALSRFTKCQTERKRLLYKDHRDLALCEDSIARCYASLGDYSMSADHLYKSVEFSRLIYGSQSVEYGHELQKLSEVLFTAERLTECLEVAQKAYAILKDSYRNDHDALRQLEGLIMTTTVGLNPLPSQKRS